MSEPFLAEVRIFSGNFAPRGWAFCNGQLLPIAQNTALFSLIGTTYGGDGRTTFALPNLKDRLPMHPGRGPGLTSRTLGERTGVQTVTLNELEMPSHNHIIRANDAAAGDEALPTNNFIADVVFTENFENIGAMDSASLSVSGGGQSHANEQPYLAMYFCIATVGTFPSRG